MSYVVHVSRQEEVDMVAESLQPRLRCWAVMSILSANERQY